MNYTILNPRASFAETVCLVGIGRDGHQFVIDLSAEASPPLAELLRPTAQGDLASIHPSRAEDVNLAGMVILFMVFSTTATLEEADAAWCLIRHVKRDHDNINLIGIFLQREEGKDLNHMKHRLEIKRVVDAVDGRIYITDENACAMRQSVGWLFGALRKLTLDGILILEPAWDLQDVTEVLELPGAKLNLITTVVREVEPVDSAVERSLECLVAEGVEMEFVGGMMVILWYSPSHRLTSLQRRQVSRSIDGLLDQGVLHLTLTVRTQAEWNDKHACVTLIVSTWDHWPELPAHAK